MSAETVICPKCGSERDANSGPCVACSVFRNDPELKERVMREREKERKN